MYFITDKDPNYIIKGSRDPLGLQVLWQNAGRKLIPHLSTVSSSIKDFQIICLAYALKKKLAIADRDFEPFFLRFEQMMDYTRYHIAPQEGFNGVEKVRKVMAANPNSIKISTASFDQLLSNQKAYGIWGKYNSPFSEMKMVTSPDFDAIFGQKIQRNPALLKKAEVLSQKKDTQSTTLTLAEMEAWQDVLDKPDDAEKHLFIDKLLQDNCGNELLSLIKANTALQNPGSFYTLTNALIESSDNQNFKSVIRHIVHTERVISPLNRVFRYLQTKSYWKKEELASDQFITNWRTAFDPAGLDETTTALGSLMAADNLALVSGLVKRNELVAARRKSSPWMQFSANGLEVNHFEGSFVRTDYDPEHHNDFDYFLSSFTSLYNQLS